MDDLSHLDDRGQARMVDVGAKPETERRAVAAGTLTVGPETRRAIFEGGLPKGDVVAVARIAAIQAAKRTSDLIPLCHPLPLSSVAIDVSETADGVRIEATVTTMARTGVEMEAMTAVSVGLLAVYDMVKGLDRGAEIGPIHLLAKSGGSSGEWRR